MEVYSYIRSLCDKGENTEVEFKSAIGGFPNSFWEIYSTFGNTAGGIIVLGIKEKNHKFTPDHLTAEQVTKYKKQYWDDVHNRSKVNTCLTADDDVMESGYGDSTVLIVKIHRAVYDMVDLTLFLGSTTTKPAETTQKTTQKITTKDKILALVRENPAITTEEMADIIGITRDGINYHLKMMRGVSLERRNGDNGGYWAILEKQ